MDNIWQHVNVDDLQITERLKVDGGYLYRTTIKSHIQPTFAMSYVPAIDLTRYQAHLRDAYNKGYSDGQEDAKHGVKGE
jgi:hypothetical protein